MLIAEIKIGNRVRKEQGDIAALADSIRTHGMLHPVVVAKDGTLVAGHRRIEAARMLGLSDVPATIVDVSDLLSAERDENTVRKDFTETEAIAIGRILEEQHRAKVAAARPEIGRQAVALRADRRSSSRTKKQVVTARLGSTRAVVARAVGMSESKYDRAKAVVVAAESDQVRFGDLPAVMDETGNVSGAYREMQRRKGGSAPRDPQLRRHAAHRPSAKRVIEGAIGSLEGVCFAVGDIEDSALVDLSPADAASWVASLEPLVAELRKLCRRLKSCR